MNHIEVKVLLSEKKIISFLRKITFGPRTRCLKCGYTKIKQLPDKRYWCKKCRRRFSLTSNSWLKGKKISLKQLYLLLHCWLKGKTVKDTIDSVRLSRQTVYLWFRTFRTANSRLKPNTLRCTIPPYEKENGRAQKIKIVEENFVEAQPRQRRGAEAFVGCSASEIFAKIGSSVVV